ncbi:dihydrolipoamide acyltransferase [Rhodococcus oxybenzonivorans]|uniref:Dihydrolipoamide acyltransferase n=1 Tax=Rhodococcus oxybenzonivorans TaxID=1990687 RepID=A0A2S2BZA9_9NOCA|nr:lipoyl domain-containing protein [Rhodococcus oxybenzonivorans]AWK73894.1 dihydrolipoamide acyltransferase [Rhodococcus oxybenzonivorans]RYF58568.1 MAG: biotin/lipoyl-binding protein [Comamonadaceae bacterium]
MLEIRIPQASMEMTEGYVAEWLADDGDQVAEGQVIYVLEADKAQLEVESPANGVLRVIAEVDTAYPVGHVVATIEES